MSDTESKPEASPSAAELAERLLKLDPEDLKSRDEGKAEVGGLALDLQKQAVEQSEILKAPLRTLSKRAEDGGDVAKALIDLKMQVEGLDPARLELEPGWLSRMAGRLPGIGSPIKRYFSKFESAQTTIAAILKSLELGKAQLERDNLTLGEDQKRMDELSRKLAQAVRVGQEVDQKLQYALDREIPAGSERYRFVSEEIVFPLRQRILDLQQQLAVNQQGVMACELVIRNNQELARGVDRALSVTVTALHVGVTVALALENQKITLDKLDAVGKTTSALIAGTAARLKTQGVQIQQRASGTQLDMNSLKSAFTDLRSAVDDLSKFRSQALPQMATRILELDQLSGEAAQTVARMEKGRQTRPQLEGVGSSKAVPDSSGAR